jgi:hypothetical protein
MLASNEGAEAWMDEGVNEWADAEAIGNLYGEKAGAIDWMGFTMDVDRLRRLAQSMADVPQPIATASWAFVDDDAYAAATYTKTLLALGTLENLVGRDPFLAAMKSYAQEFAFKHPTGRDFFASISKSLDRNLDWFWDPVFHGTGTAELSVRSADCRPKVEPRGVFGDGDDRKVVLDDKATGTYACDVEIANTGSVHLPVHIEVHFADGTVQPLDWNDPGESVHDFPIDRSSPITEVVIDPDGQILLTDDKLDDAVRLDPDSHASLRAAARITYWTQTGMEGFGL